MVGDCPEPVAGETGALSIWGWMHREELAWLAEQAARMRSVVEIGSLHGRSAYALLDACPGPVICVDPWNDLHDTCFASFMGSVGHFPNLVPMRGFSPGILYLPEMEPHLEGGFDMVFVDGAHDYDSVANDISHWLPHANRLICGHDFYPDEGAGFPDVATVVCEMFGDGYKVAEGTSIWYVEVG
jgi:hypothetical protein